MVPAVFALGLIATVILPARAAGTPALLISDPVQIWGLSTEQKSIVHRLDISGRVSYVDRRWRHLWLERNGESTYLMLSPQGPALLQGQVVRIQGTILPTFGLDAGAVRVTVEQAYAPGQPRDVAGRIGQFDALHNRIVTMQGYVDSQLLIDADHVHLSLIAENQPVTVYVKPADPTSVPEWAGRFVSVTGLYQGRFDPTHTQGAIEIWTARQDDVVVTDSTAQAHQFDAPVTLIRDLYARATGTAVKVRGRAMSSTPGTGLVLRDDTGQVVVQSLQQQRVPGGAEVEAVGPVEFVNAQWVLHPALFRIVARPTAPAGEPSSEATVLGNVAQIRALSLEEAAQSRPVSITGVVTWSMSGQDFFFFEDVTGGLRIRFRSEQLPTPPRNKYLHIDGVTYNGGFAPAVDLRGYQDLGAMNTPPVKTITYDQAITGQEDGQLVNMRGFYRTTVSEGDLRRIHVTTPAGEFIGVLKSSVDFKATPGSLIRVHGPCEVVADENGRLSGIIIRVPSLAGLKVEEEAPANPFDLPVRSIKHLRQLNTSRELTRVRIAGVVLQAEPGRAIYVQEDNAGLLLLSHETTPLVPGDRIEAVGILGWEGVRTVVREATYRRLGGGEPPTPERVDDPARLSLALDSRLVRVRGTLIDLVRRPDRVRLTLQVNNALFEAVLEQPAMDLDSAVTPGAGLELTGVYRIGFDDSHQSRSFQVQLRSPADVMVVRRARVLTVPRAVFAAGVLAGCLLLGIAWVTALRRRVRRQTEQIRTQLERQAQLEAQVQHATRLESLGVLAGGIAHDFNNLLTIIMGNLGLAMLDERAMAAVGGSLRDCHRGANRARDLTQQLLTFAKGGDPLRATVSLSGIVRETTEFVLRGSNCRPEYQIAPGLWNADVDRAQVAQVVQNLVLNAKQAMAHGGIIEIALGNAEVAPGATPPLTAGRYLRLVISDRGQGIAPENLSRIFDPYFSTKKTGSGLGLATVYSIVKKHDGHIQVTSTPGQGTTFTLWLPAAAPSAPCAIPATPTPGCTWSTTHRARVLLMDDEDPIRRLGAAVLERMNLETILVADGEEAVREFAAARDAGRPFDLVILDLTIPGAMGGREAIARIRELDADVPAIVSSGYSNDPVLADYQQSGFQAMVTKPYDVLQLSETVQLLLARRRVSPPAPPHG